MVNSLLLMLLSLSYLSVMSAQTGTLVEICVQLLVIGSSRHLRLEKLRLETH